MGWLRILVAIVLSVLFLGGTAMTVAMITGLWRMDLLSAPGLNPSDSAALAEPYRQLVAGEDDAIVARLAEGLDRQAAATELKRLRQLIPPDQEQSSRLLRWSLTASGEFGSVAARPDQRLFGLHEIVYPDHVVRVETELARAAQDQPWGIRNFHVTVVPKTQAGAGEFTLSGKPTAFVALVLAAMLAPVFCWLTALRVLFAKQLKHRWLWLLMVSIGLTTFTLNSATGEISFSPLSFQLLAGSASWSGSALEPWIFGVSLPLGALAFWLTRPRQRRQAAAPT